MIACKDCKYVEVGTNDTVCTHPKSYGGLPDYYTGRMLQIPRPIAIMRTFGDCKHEALLFEEWKDEDETNATSDGEGTDPPRT